MFTYTFFGVFFVFGILLLYLFLFLMKYQVSATDINQSEIRIGDKKLLIELYAKENQRFNVLVRLSNSKLSFSFSLHVPL